MKFLCRSQHKSQKEIFCSIARHFRRGRRLQTSRLNNNPLSFDVDFKKHFLQYTQDDSFRLYLIKCNSHNPKEDTFLWFAHQESVNQIQKRVQKRRKTNATAIICNTEAECLLYFGHNTKRLVKQTRCFLSVIRSLVSEESYF